MRSPYERPRLCVASPLLVDQRVGERTGIVLAAIGLVGDRGQLEIEVQQDDVLAVGDAAALVPQEPVVPELACADEARGRRGLLNDIGEVEELAAVRHLADRAGKIIPDGSRN